MFLLTWNRPQIFTLLSSIGDMPMYPPFAGLSPVCISSPSICMFVMCALMPIHCLVFFELACFSLPDAQMIPSLFLVEWRDLLIRCCCIFPPSLVNSFWSSSSSRCLEMPVPWLGSCLSRTRVSAMCHLMFSIVSACLKRA